MRGLFCAGLLGLAACNSLVGTDQFTLATCFGSLVEVCLPLPPTDDVMLGTTTVTSIDTKRDPRCTDVIQPNGDDMCAIAGVNVLVVGTIIASGTRPLLLIGSNSVTIDGTVDASSHHYASTLLGAGANTTECAPSASGMDGPTDTGGGAGGSFGTQGGNGAASQTGIAGGVATPAVSPTAIRGGCIGGDAGGVPGTGGWGGGAVYIVAGHTITINAAIFAVGEGGFGGPPMVGGGGGGTGGMIALDAKTITVSGTLSANGGGGGGGGDTTAGGTGGDDGARIMYMLPAAGGQGATAGGTGGSGAAVTAAATAGTMPSMPGGGGGGGGGAGVIWVHGDLMATKISPPPTFK